MSQNVDGLEAEIRRRLRVGIEDRQSPGGAVTFGSSLGCLGEIVEGYLTYERQEPVTSTTMYDLASVTKVMAGTSLAAIGVDRGLISLDDHVDRFHQEYCTLRWSSLTIRNLLGHSCGQPPWLPLYKKGLDRDGVRRLLADLDPVARPTTSASYSDLDFLVLWDVLETAFDVPLEKALCEEILEPLGIDDDCTYLPTRRGMGHRCAPTEDCPWRGQVLTGVVHDENCYGLGGIAPHAGLFATAGAVGRLVSEWLAAVQGDSTWLGQATAQEFTRRQGPPDGVFAMGWATPFDGAARKGPSTNWPWRLSAAGPSASSRSFGHSGFTGVSVFADPLVDRWVVAATNRVHPDRTTTGIPALRSEIAEIVLRGSPEE